MTVEALQAAVADLKRQLDQNSRDSSKPPSSDSPFAKPTPKSLRRKSGRKPGGRQVGMERRQVFDLPPVTVRVIEHQLIARRCACGTTTCGAAPEDVTAPVRCGPRITAVILYLYVGQFLSKKACGQPGGMCIRLPGSTSPGVAGRRETDVEPTRRRPSLARQVAVKRPPRTATPGRTGPPAGNGEPRDMDS